MNDALTTSRTSRVMVPLPQSGASASLPPPLVALAAQPYIQELSFSPDQILLYEGHIAPGCFVFWDGIIQLQSALFQEQRIICLVDPTKSTHHEHPLDTPDEVTTSIEHWWVFPERQQLPLSLPFTVSTRTHTQALLIPRSQIAQPHIQEIMHLL